MVAVLFQLVNRLAFTPLLFFIVSSNLDAAYPTERLSVLSMLPLRLYGVLVRALVADNQRRLGGLGF